MNKLIDKILKESPDPLEVRSSTSLVFKNLELIKIDFDKIVEVSKIIADKIEQKQLLDEEQFGSLEPSPQLIFILDTVNFCFWAEKNKEKWTVEFPRGNFISNGWYGLVAAIERARFENIPILDADYLSKLSQSEGEYIFRSASSTEIPLLEKRIAYLNEVGKILSQKYDGNIYNFISETNLDFSKLVLNLVKTFPSFSDTLKLNGKKVNFYKRAQIFAYDISLLPEIKAEGLDSLTAFADYKIPQILRAFEVFKYNKSLANKIDNYLVLEEGCREEIEIRSATIWACELIAYQANIKPVLVDNALWKMSQSLRDVKPYHRVVTTNY